MASKPSGTRYRTLRLCSSGGGFEAIPLERGRVDLAALRGALDRAGVPYVDARVMLIASFDAEVTISGTGRILIKTPDPALAERVFARVLGLLRPVDSGPGRATSAVRSG